jgi:hypothetical protein
MLISKKTGNIDGRKQLMRRSLLFIFLCLQTFLSMAAAVSFIAKTSSAQLEVGQRVQITFTVNASADNFIPPSFPKLNLLSGPNQSQSMQYINGKVSRTTSISYILQATEEGKVEIEAASIVVDGKTYRSNPLEIEIVAASAGSANAHRNRQQQRKANGESLEDHVFIKAFVDRKEAFVGEKVTVNYKLYSRFPISGINLESLPSFNGFWSQDIRSVYDQIELSREQIDGVLYQTAELQQTLLYPQRSGVLSIDPLKMLVSVQTKSRRSRSVFEQMFGGSYEYQEIIAQSDPIKVKVQPLPTKNKPATFSGAVGAFTMKMTANKDSVLTNEAINVKVVIEGNGNLPLISAPQLSFPPDFEVYDPETTNNFKSGYNGVKGSKTFSYLVIPRHSGSFQLPAYNFNYFDQKTQQYKTIKADPIRIEVAKGAEEENVVFNSNRKEEVALLNTDIRFIHTQGVMLIDSDDFFFASPLFYSCILLTIIIAALAFWYAGKLKDRNADQIGLRKAKANKLAKKRMAKAKKHLEEKELSLFYEELSYAIYGYFADKFNISMAEMSQERIMQLLANKENSAELREELRSTLEEAEMARFAPSSSINADQLYNNSVNIISKMENL